jgi:uncharacterized membrane protein
VSGHLLFAYGAALLLISGAMADMAGFAARKLPVRQWGGWLLVIGSVAAIVAFFTGSAAARNIPVTAETVVLAERIELHTMIGSLATWMIAAMAALRVVWWRRLDGQAGILTLLAGAGSAALALVVLATGAAIHG